MDNFSFSMAIPQLPSGDIEVTADFFMKSLGFEVVAKIKEHNFLIVRRGPAEIHFWQAEDEKAAREVARASSCYIRVKNIEPFYQELKKRQTKFRYELQKMPWQMHEMQIDDPYGNAIKFGEPL